MARYQIDLRTWKDQWNHFPKKYFHSGAVCLWWEWTGFREGKPSRHPEIQLTSFINLFTCCWKGLHSTCECCIYRVELFQAHITGELAEIFHGRHTSWVSWECLELKKVVCEISYTNCIIDFAQKSRKHRL